MQTTTIRSRCSGGRPRKASSGGILIRLAYLLAFALVTTVAGCGDDPLAPFQPEVSNLPGSFELQATGVSNVTSTLTYTWANSGDIANIDHSTTTTQGTARLVIRADDGTQVYDEVLASSLNEQTAQGAAGDWTVEVILSNYSGTLNFRLETP